MKKILYSTLVAAALLCLPSVAFAQSSGNAQGAPIATQQSASHADACIPINATAAVANAVTLTIPAPGPGQYIYICGIDFSISADGTAGDVWTNLSFTSTNLGGWAYAFSANTSTANQNVLDKFFVWAQPLKSASPTTAVTIVSPASKTHGKYSINAYYYYAP